jgi:ribosomal protein L29
MKATKYHELDVAELERQKQDAQEQLFRLRFQIGRARILTVLTQKKANGDAAVAQVKVADAGKKAKKK